MRLACYLVPVALVGGLAGCTDDDATPPSGGPTTSSTTGGSGGSGNAGGSAAGGGAGLGGGGGGGVGGGCDSGTLVFSSDFEAGDLDGMWVDGDASVSQVQAHSGSSSALYAFSGAGHFGLTDLAGYREFYVELWAYLDDMPCLSGCDSAGKHFFRFAWWPNKSGGIQKQIDTGMLNGQVGAWWWDFGVASTGAWQDYEGAVLSQSWQRIRVGFRPNGSGQADGRFRWMFDDAVVMDLTDEFFAPDDELDTFMFTNYDFVPADGITHPQVYIDDLVVRTGPGAFDCMP